MAPQMKIVNAMIDALNMACSLRCKRMSGSRDRQFNCRDLTCDRPHAAMPKAPVFVRRNPDERSDNREFASRISRSLSSGAHSRDPLAHAGYGLFEIRIGNRDALI